MTMSALARTQVSDRFLGDGRHPDGDQLTGGQQPGQNPLPWGRGDQRRCDDLRGHTERSQQPGELVARRACLIAGPQPGHVLETADQLAHGVLVTADTLDISRLDLTPKIPTEIECLWTSSPK